MSDNPLISMAECLIELGHQGGASNAALIGMISKLVDYIRSNDATTDSTVKIPNTEDEAVLMNLLSYRWLLQYAPHRLKDQGPAQ